jgi:hypothetical protein
MIPAFSYGGGRANRDLPPEVREVMRSVGPQTFSIIVGVIFVVIELTFSTIGGLVGALVFRKASPPPSEPPLPPPRPPVIPPAGPPVESWSYPDQNQS